MGCNSCTRSCFRGCFRDSYEAKWTCGMSFIWALQTLVIGMSAAAAVVILQLQTFIKDPANVKFYKGEDGKLPPFIKVEKDNTVVLAPAQAAFFVIGLAMFVAAAVLEVCCVAFELRRFICYKKKGHEHFFRSGRMFYWYSAVAAIILVEIVVFLCIGTQNDILNRKFWPSSETGSTFAAPQLLVAIFGIYTTVAVLNFSFTLSWTRYRINRTQLEQKDAEIDDAYRMAKEAQTPPEQQPPQRQQTYPPPQAFYQPYPN